jgi:SagB-type dehydrogenase family enzyme
MADMDLSHRILPAGQNAGGDTPLYETHHLNAAIDWCDTAYMRRIFEINTSDIGHRLITRAAKRCACAERTPLPDAADPPMALADALRRRRSSPRFFGGGLSLGQLSTILKFGNGLTGTRRMDGLPRRAMPSGGALYPSEVYVLPLDVEGLSYGAYHYDVFAHELARFHQRPAEALLASACFNEMAAMSAAVALVVTGCFERQRIKYGERAYRFALLEVGHLAQNVLLTAAALNLAALPVGGFVDREINSHLEIDGVREAALYVILLGHALEGRGEASGENGSPQDGIDHSSSL